MRLVFQPSSQARVALARRVIEEALDQVMATKRNTTGHFEAARSLANVKTLLDKAAFSPHAPTPEDTREVRDARTTAMDWLS